MDNGKQWQRQLENLKPMHKLKIPLLAEVCLLKALDTSLP
jgi:hypothetical protein